MRPYPPHQPIFVSPVDREPRLWLGDRHRVALYLERNLKENSLEEVYSSVVIPALNLAEEDRHRNELDEETQKFIFQSTREIVDELGDTATQSPEAESTNSSESPRGVDKMGHLEVLCIPARDDADDVVAMLLSQLLERQGHAAETIPIGTTSEMLSQVTGAEPSVVCISALPPFALNHARMLYMKLHAHVPGVHIVVAFGTSSVMLSERRSA